MAASPRIPDLIGADKFMSLRNVEKAITAVASGTQITSFQLSGQVSRIDTVATALDGVKLPKILPNAGGILSAAGVALSTPMLVWNNTTKSVTVFPGLLDTINGVASATGIVLAGGAAAWFVPIDYTQATKVGTWLALPVTLSFSGFSQFTALSGNTPLTLTGANMAGATDVTINLTATLAGAGTLNSATAAQIIAAIPNAIVGSSYNLRIINSSGGAFAWTLTTATGVTLTGTMSIAQNTYRDFVVTVTGAATVTIQQVGTGTTS